LEEKLGIFYKFIHFRKLITSILFFVGARRKGLQKKGVILLFLVAMYFGKFKYLKYFYDLL